MGPFKLGSPLGLWGLIGIGIVGSLIFPGWVVWGVFFESAAASPEAVWATWGPLVGAHLLTGTILALGLQLRTITQAAKEWRDAWEDEAE